VISTPIRAVQNPDDSFDELLTSAGIQGSDFSNHQISARGEQLTGPGVAVRAKRTGGEAGRRQVDGPWVAIWVTRDLAEDPVTTAGVGQDRSRPKLCLRKIGERERDEDYPAG
jgi:hypothetical protein